MNQPKSQKHVCPTCGWGFALKATLRAHVLSHAKSPNTVSGSSIKEITSQASNQPGQIIPSQTSDDDSLHGAAHAASAIVMVDLPSNDFSKGDGLSIPEIPPAPDPEKVITSEDSSSVGTSLDSAIHSQKPVEAKFLCTTCSKGFDAIGKLDQHKASKSHQNRVLSAAAVSGTTKLPSNDFPTAQAGSSTLQMPVAQGIDKDVSSESEFSPPYVLTDSESNVPRQQKPTQAPTTAKFYCHVCSKGFDAKQKLAQHNASDGHQFRLAEKKVAADSGGDGVATVAPKVSKVSGNYTCTFPDCGKVFDNPTKLVQHQSMKKHEVDQFTCEIGDCGRAFPSENRLVQHLKDKHQNENPEKDQIQLVDSSTSTYRRYCDDCVEFNEEASKKSFIFLTFIAKHIVAKHLPPSHTRGFCHICNTKVEKTKNLLTHLARTHLWNKFKDDACFICLRICKDKADLEHHRSSVHRFKCMMDECHSMYPSKSMRDKHMQQKHGVYACSHEDCQSIFTSLDEKTRHSSIPHPVDSESDSSLPITRHRPMMYRNTPDTGTVSEPQRFLAHQLSDNMPFSADERRLPFSESAQYSAHRIFRNNLYDLKNSLVFLKGPLSLPVDPQYATQTIDLCNEVVEDLQNTIHHLRNNFGLFVDRLTGSDDDI